MSSFMSNLLTTTTSRYNSLRRTLLSDEADGDTEDDTHISRVLRAYYTEKGRPFPPWLPPDPRAPQSAPAQFVSSTGRQPGGPQMGRGGGGLSDLWDSTPPQQQQEPLSLRRAQGRGGGGRTLRPGMLDSYSAEPQLQGRPLPSQRAGSYQSSAGGRPEPSPPPSAGSGSTAQERLKARLWGSGRSSSPSQSPAPSMNTNPASEGMRSPYDRSGGQGGRSSYPEERGGDYGRQQTNYEDQFAPPAQNVRQPRQPPGGGRIGLPSGPRMRS